MNSTKLIQSEFLPLISLIVGTALLAVFMLCRIWAGVVSGMILVSLLALSASPLPVTQAQGIGSESKWSCRNIE